MSGTTRKGTVAFSLHINTERIDYERMRCQTNL